MRERRWESRSRLEFDDVLGLGQRLALSDIGEPGYRAHRYRGCMTVLATSLSAALKVP
jgi:hypothetical protein